MRFTCAFVYDDPRPSLADLDATIAAGTEDRVTPDVERVLGQLPRHFEDFAT